MENTSIRKNLMRNSLIGLSLPEKNTIQFGCWLVVALSAFVFTIHSE